MIIGLIIATIIAFISAIIAFGIFSVGIIVPGLIVMALAIMVMIGIIGIIIFII